MNRWARGAAALGLGFGLTVLAIEIEQHTSDHSDPPGTILGALDIVRHCTDEFGDRARAIHPNEGAYGWQCWVFVDGLLTSHPVDGDQGCARQYGGPAYAEASQVDDPNSWLCKRGPRPTT